VKKLFVRSALVALLTTILAAGIIAFANPWPIDCHHFEGSSGGECVSSNCEITSGVLGTCSDENGRDHNVHACDSDFGYCWDPISP